MATGPSASRSGRRLPLGFASSLRRTTSSGGARIWRLTSTSVESDGLLSPGVQREPRRLMPPGQHGGLSGMRGTRESAGTAGRGKLGGRWSIRSLGRTSATGYGRLARHLSAADPSARGKVAGPAAAGRWASREMIGPAVATRGDRRPGRRSPAGVGHMAVGHARAAAGHPVRGRRTHFAVIVVVRPQWTVGRGEGTVGRRGEPAIDAGRGQTATASSPKRAPITSVCRADGDWSYCFATPSHEAHPR
jgi:hypothetical protein